MRGAIILALLTPQAAFAHHEVVVATAVFPAVWALLPVAVAAYAAFTARIRPRRNNARAKAGQSPS